VYYVRIKYFTKIKFSRNFVKNWRKKSKERKRLFWVLKACVMQKFAFKSLNLCKCKKCGKNSIQKLKKLEKKSEKMNEFASNSSNANNLEKCRKIQ
jgi:hypothetical protein